MSERQRLTTKGRWVVKIGSSLLTNDGQGLNKSAIASWVRQLVQLRQQGVDVILVSSGAVAEGMSRLGWTVRPREVSKLQAAAAVGQMGLVQCWEAAFFEHEVATAQVLLTHDDLSNRKRYLNARSALKTLIELNVVPVINENDTVVTDEIRLGDNDTLGALVVNAVEADALILLTDQQGLFTQDPRKNPNAELIHSARAEDEALEGVAGEGGVLGRGGMVTKVRAARLAARSGAVTVIANGREQDVLMRLALGENVGTCLIPDREPVVARKQWIAGHLQARGILTIDEGAVKALKYQGRSLLAAGVFRIAGDFSRGEMVLIQNELEQVIARGLINYGANDALKIMGRPTREIETILGYMGEPELIHRDNLVLA